MTSERPPRAPRARRRASPAVYRRRRLVAVLGLAVVTLVVVLGVRALADVVSGGSAQVAGTAPADADTPQAGASRDGEQTRDAAAAAAPAAGPGAGAPEEQADGSDDEAPAGQDGGDAATGDDAEQVAGDGGPGGDGTTDAGGRVDGTDGDATADGKTGDGETADGETGDGETADGEAADGEGADGDAIEAGDAAPADGPEAPVTLPAATDAPTCTAGSVQVLAAADSAAAAAGTNPVLSAVVRAREGAEPCAVVLGSDTVGLQVSSGSEQVYDSAHCPREVSGPQHGRPVLVAPGLEARVAVTWARVHSAPGCPAGMPAAESGTYQVTASVDGVASEPLRLTLAD